MKQYGLEDMVIPMVSRFIASGCQTGTFFFRRGSILVTLPPSFSLRASQSAARDSHMNVRWTTLCLAALILASPRPADAQEKNPKGVEFFEAKIRPVLV